MDFLSPFQIESYYFLLKKKKNTINGFLCEDLLEFFRDQDICIIIAMRSHWNQEQRSPSKCVWIAFIYNFQKETCHGITKSKIHSYVH